MTYHHLGMLGLVIRMDMGCVIVTRRIFLVQRQALAIDYHSSIHPI